MNLSKITTPLTSSQLRDRALSSMNGEAASLSRADRERRRRVLEAIRRRAES